jgi:hypothetical protein
MESAPPFYLLWFFLFEVILNTECVASLRIFIPPWFSEVTLLAHYLSRQGMLKSIQDRVRIARRLLTTL